MSHNHFSSMHALLAVAVLAGLTSCGGSETPAPAPTQTEPAAASTGRNTLTDGAQIINDAQQQVNQIMADSETRIDEAVDQAEAIADETEEEARKRAEELQNNVRSQLGNFGN
jgi:hypothetical protein